MDKIKQMNFNKLIAYGIIGLLGTLIHFTSLVFFVEIINLDPVLSSSIGFILTIIVSFILNKKFTFKVKTRSNSILFIKYTIVSFTGFFINSLIMYSTVHLLSIHYSIGQAIVVIVLPISNFLLNNYWTFYEKMES